MISIEKFKLEIENGKQGVFYYDNFFEILTSLKESGLTAEELKDKFIGTSISLFLNGNSKSELKKFLVHLIKRNQGKDNWADFATKVEAKTGFSKDKTSWSRYAAKPPKVKTSAEIIFYLLLFENPHFLTDQNITERKELNLTSKAAPTYTKRNYLLFIISFVIFLFLFIFLRSFSKNDIVWREDFDKNSPGELKAAGWEFIDFDSTYWNQMRDGHLTLFTQYGVYQHFPPDSTVHNMTIRKLDCECCEITVKLVDFNPYNRWEGAGILLLNEKKERRKTVRYSFLTLNPDTIPETRFPNAPSTVNHRRAFQIYTYNQEAVKHDTRVTTHIEFPVTSKPTPEKEIIIKLRFEDNKYTYYGSLNNQELNPKVMKIDFDFKPYYLALTCEGAGEKARKFPNSVDDIPAHFDFVEVKHCD